MKTYLVWPDDLREPDQVESNKAIYMEDVVKLGDMSDMIEDTRKKAHNDALGDLEREYKNQLGNQTLVFTLIERLRKP